MLGSLIGVAAMLSWLALMTAGVLAMRYIR